MYTVQYGHTQYKTGIEQDGRISSADMEVSLYHVYELVDPRTGTAGYIGITMHPEIRLQQHMACNDSNKDKGEWIKAINDAGLSLQMNIIETVDGREDAKDREKYWIQNYIERGISLYNFQHASIPYVPRKVTSQRSTVKVDPFFKRTSSEKYYVDFDDELLSIPEYLEDYFLDWIDEIERMEGRTLTQEEIRSDLDIVTIMVFSRGKDDVVSGWYNKQFEAGGRFEGDHPTLNLA